MPPGNLPFRGGDIKSRVLLEWGGVFGFFTQKIVIERSQSQGSVSMRITGLRDYLTSWTIVD
jgi:hypothetical protein